MNFKEFFCFVGLHDWCSIEGYFKDVPFGSVSEHRKCNRCGKEEWIDY